MEFKLLKVSPDELEAAQRQHKCPTTIPNDKCRTKSPTTTPKTVSLELVDDCLIARLLPTSNQ